MIVIKPMGFLGVLFIGQFLMAQSVCRVSDFGAIGDGFTNDIEALRKASIFVCQQGGGTVVFEAGKTYFVKLEEVSDERPIQGMQENATIMRFNGCNRVRVEMNGATISLAPNHRTEYAFFHFMNCGRFTISNGTLIGDALEHDYSDIVRYGKQKKSTHEWGYGILVNGSRGTICNMNISNMTGDGIKTGSICLKGEGTYHSSVTIEDSEISFCRRNGLSILSSLGTTVSNVTIHHIGTYEKIIGTAPQAGIDLEYEDGVGDTGSVIIKNCRIIDCTQKVISASNSTPPNPKNLVIENCYLEGSDFQIANTIPGKSMTVKNCTVVNCPINLGKAIVSNTSFQLRQSVNYVSGGDYRHCSFRGILGGFDTNHGCTITGTSLTPVKFTDCSFSDIRAANNKSPVYQGFSAYHFPLRASFYHCHFSNCSFVRGNPEKASTFQFYNSDLSDGCMIYNENDDIPVTFSKCTLKDVSSFHTQKGRFEFNRCIIIQDDPSVSLPILLFGTNTLTRCTVQDNVGYPPSAQRFGIHSYKLEASRCSFEFQTANPLTEGLILERGTVRGLSKNIFKGNEKSIRFK